MPHPVMSYLILDFTLVQVSTAFITLCSAHLYIPGPLTYFATAAVHCES